MHISLQDGQTALMLASVAWHMECVMVLLDKGADVNLQNKVSGVILHCVHQCSMYPESPVVKEYMCTRTLFSACMPSN